MNEYRQIMTIGDCARLVPIEGKPNAIGEVQPAAIPEPVGRGWMLISAIPLELEGRSYIQYLWQRKIGLL